MIRLTLLPAQPTHRPNVNKIFIIKCCSPLSQGTSLQPHTVTYTIYILSLKLIIDCFLFALFSLSFSLISSKCFIYENIKASIPYNRSRSAPFDLIWTSCSGVWCVVGGESHDPATLAASWLYLWDLSCIEASVSVLILVAPSLLTASSEKMQRATSESFS